jgi:hypothetical protein
MVPSAEDFGTVLLGNTDVTFPLLCYVCVWSRGRLLLSWTCLFIGSHCKATGRNTIKWVVFLCSSMATFVKAIIYFLLKTSMAKEIFVHTC